jgi:hypothetical protein
VTAQPRPSDSRHVASTLDFDGVIDELRRTLAGITHGSVTLIVQDGRVVQIDTTQKVRIDRRRGAPPGAGRTA